MALAPLYACAWPPSEFHQSFVREGASTLLPGCALASRVGQPPLAWLELRPLPRAARRSAIEEEAVRVLHELLDAL